MEQSLERKGHEHSRKMLISLSISLQGAYFFHWRVKSILYFSSAFALLFDMGTSLLVPDLGAWVFPVTCSFPAEEAHFSTCGSFNSQTSHFYPVTPTYSNTPCLSLAKHQEASASSFHKRADPRFPILTGLEVHQSGCKEVSLLGLPLLNHILWWTALCYSKQALEQSASAVQWTTNVTRNI